MKLKNWHSFKHVLLLIGLVMLIGCKKDAEPEGPFLPAGVTAYSDEQVALVPYSSGDQLFKKAPGFTTELLLTFIERKATKEFVAWDQTFFQMGADPYLIVEFRLRYLQTANETHKTLAIYMPYWDDSGVIRSTIFEFPIQTTDFSSGFFKTLITYHSTIDLGGTTWNNVYEIRPITSTPASEESPDNFNLVYYSTTVGLIGMNQVNGDEWVLFP